MEKIKVRFIFVILLSAGVLTVQGQDSNSYSGHTQSSKSVMQNKASLLKWWDSFSDCTAKKLIDTIKYEKSYRIVVGGQIPVQYTMYGSTSDGGIVKFKIRMELTENSCEYVFYDLEHKATPGVKHKDGGPVLAEKPLKGSTIFGKTWTSYQEQTMSFIHATENEIIKVVK